MTQLPIPAAFGAVLVSLAGLAGTADARTFANCAPRETVLDRLASGFGETRQSIGLGANDHVIEVFASRETGTWTITMTNAQGLTCLIASGQAFETLVEELPVKGDDA